ncbi:diaminobutyrate acetyltransferase [Pararhodobacter sp. SW119]|uniref:diaminobutyrate acetyltransferase n=1 Tax=Pararhodobacter sp. SW119 TaxID=2780075 RepID=UPI001ADF444E|nr:diaminobutyrate acetyltransferase [Pararhodobacter sp. SW119]
MKDMIETPASKAPSFRKPAPEDGSNVWALIRACEPLDDNSMYCNLIQCDHFADTCILAELDGVPVGWVSGYLLPDAPDTLFVWQVAVAKEARGLGLASQMLDRLLSREDMAGVLHLKTTITRDNKASWALFGSLAERHGGKLTDEPHYRKDDHFDGEHATEYLVSIRFPAPVARVA